MIQKLPKIIKPIIIALLGVYLTNKFNIFEYMPFIPTEKSFDICITVYFAILEIFSGFLAEIIYTKFMSEISVILSLDNSEISVNSIPIIKFNSEELSEAILTVQIIGRKKHFSNTIIMLPNTGCTTMQPSIHSKEASIDKNGNFIIDLEKLFGTTNKKISVSSSFRITFVKELVDNERMIEISPELKNNFPYNFHPAIFYKHNKAQLKIERSV